MRTNSSPARCIILAMVLYAFNMHAQDVVLHTASPGTVERDHTAEQKLADSLLIEISKRGWKAPRLVKPTDFDLQMTCNAAVDPRQINNAKVYGLEIARAETSELPSLLNRLAESARATKDEPGFTIAVFRTTDNDGKTILTLGFSKIESRWNHIKGCLFTEDGCSDHTWQKAVTPACKDFRQ